MSENGTGNQSSRRVAYAVSTYNGTRLVETIHSIPVGERCLVLDNSQHDKSLAWLWNYAYDRLIGFEKYDYVVMMNDDVILQPNTGQLLAEVLAERQFQEERPSRERMLLIVTAYNIRDVDPKTFGGIDVDWAPAANWNSKLVVHSERKEYPEKYGPNDLGGFKPRWGTGPDYSCFCFGRPLFQQVGRFDEKIPLYFEDNDSHFRIKGSGYDALSYAPYWHYGSTTTNSTPEIQERVANLYRESEAYYIQKWGGLPGQEKFLKAFGK
jgi:hypothetical protein